MVAMIVDVLEHVESGTTDEVVVGDRVRVQSGLYRGLVGDVKLIIATDEDSGQQESPPRRDIA